VWYREWWSVPDKGDWYIMQLQSSLTGRTARPIKFGAPAGQPRTREEADVASKSRFATMFHLRGGMKEAENAVLTPGQMKLREMALRAMGRKP
jgi:hypothetical protein